MNNTLMCLFIMFIVIICGTNEFTVFAHSTAEKPSKRVCIEESKEKYENFNNEVLNEILKSYKLDLSGYKEYKHDDLNLKVGDNLNTHSDKISLQHLFTGSSIGSRRLFLENGLEGKRGYFLYKSIDGNNVLKELHKEGKIWVAMSVSKKKGKRLWLKPFNWNKCKEE